jgi:hypothetical protein
VCAGRFTLKLAVNFKVFQKILNFTVNFNDFLQIRCGVCRLRPLDLRLAIVRRMPLYVDKNNP